MARCPAGEIVVQVERGGCVALELGQAEDGLRGVEEDVGVGASAVEVEEVEVELFALARFLVFGVVRVRNQRLAPLVFRERLKQIDDLV